MIYLFKSYYRKVFQRCISILAVILVANVRLAFYSSPTFLYILSFSITKRRK